MGHIRAIFHRYPEHIAVLGILLIGLFLRLYSAHTVLWWDAGYDETRDALVARHIVVYHELPVRGPLAAGTQGQVPNSPFYYYLIAFFFSLGKSAYALQFWWIIFSSASILLAYFIGRSYHRYTGLLLAILVAIHPTLIGMARHYSQPNITPLFVFGVLFLMVGKRYRVARIVGIILLYSCAVHAHFGSLILAPGVLLYLLYEWKKCIRDHVPFITLLLPLVVGEMMVMVWIFSTSGFRPFGQFEYFASQGMGHLSSIVPLIGSATRVLLESMTPGISDSWYWPILGGMAVLLLLSSKRKKYAVYVIALFLSMLGVSWYGAVPASYLYSSIPLFLLLVSFALTEIIHRSRIVGIVVSVTVVGYLLLETNPFNYPHIPVTYYDAFRNAAHAISRDKGGDPTSAVLALLTPVPSVPYDALGTGGIWYFLEQETKTRLVRITSDNISFRPREKRPKYFYVVCDRRDKEERPMDQCAASVRKNRPYLQGEGEDIYDSDWFSIRRFGIDSSIPVSDYNKDYSYEAKK